MCIFHLKIRSFCHKWFIWKQYYSWQRNRNRSVFLFLSRLKKKKKAMLIYSLFNACSLKNCPSFLPHLSTSRMRNGSVIAGTFEQPLSLYIKQVTETQSSPAPSHVLCWCLQPVASPNVIPEGLDTCSILASILALPSPCPEERV